MACPFGAVAQTRERAVPQTIYVLMLAVLWSAVGASVFFLRTHMSLAQRLGLTIATSLVFGAVGWVDVSSIFHAVRADADVVARGSVRPDLPIAQAHRDADR